MAYEKSEQRLVMMSTLEKQMPKTDRFELLFAIHLEQNSSAEQMVE